MRGICSWILSYKKRSCTLHVIPQKAMRNTTATTVHHISRAAVSCFLFAAGYTLAGSITRAIVQAVANEETAQRTAGTMVPLRGTPRPFLRSMLIRGWRQIYRERWQFDIASEFFSAHDEIIQMWIRYANGLWYITGRKGWRLHSGQRMSITRRNRWIRLWRFARWQHCKRHFQRCVGR